MVNFEEKEVEEIPKEESQTLEVEISEMKMKLEEHFTAIKNMLRYSKEKDMNISILNATLQKYRDGFTTSLFKAVALNIIGYREDCQKALREFSERDLTITDAKKYLEYIYLDFQDLLENIGIMQKEESWFYNGKDLSKGIEAKVEFEEPEKFEFELETIEVNTLEELYSYLVKTEQEIEKILNVNKELDKLLAKYLKYTAVYEAGIEQVVLYPVIRKCVKTFESIEKEIQEQIANLNEENSKNAYIEELNKTIEELDKILSLCNVEIIRYVSDSFDSKMNRILKVIPALEECQDGLVVKRYTDCYLLEEKVIYPQKIDVYKWMVK